MVAMVGASPAVRHPFVAVLAPEKGRLGLAITTIFFLLPFAGVLLAIRVQVSVSFLRRRHARSVTNKSVRVMRNAGPRARDKRR